MFQTSVHNHHRLESHRALELLSDYYTKLSKSQEKQLSLELERLIRILKSRFFQALIDIKEFYEVTLFYGIERNKLEIIANPWNFRDKDFINETSYSNWNIDQHQEFTNEKWTEIEIIILRDKKELGFSISGGTDNPHLENDHYIYVTKILSNSPAEMNGRLRLNDRILKVNNISLVNVTHAAAVEILQQSGDLVALNIQRKSRSNKYNEIVLSKGAQGLGFSIAGGIGNQHIPGKNGIYVTKLMSGGSAQLDGRLQVGDKLSALKNSSGYRDLENVTHEEAVEALKCTTDKIILFTVKPENHEFNFSVRHISTLKGLKIPGNLKKMKNVSSLCINSTSMNNMKTNRVAAITQNNIDDIFDTITLRRGQKGFGFNIVGGEDKEGIFISYILEGGPASMNSSLCKGDKIISVNGIDFLHITHEEAASILKGAEDSVTLTVKHNANDYCCLEDRLDNYNDINNRKSLNVETLLKTTEKKSMYVRALFDYDPEKDDDLPSIGLSFHFGDILHVLNASDNEWWQAAKFFQNCDQFGIIPASYRWERKQKAKERSVKFEGPTSMHIENQSDIDRRKKNYSFSRKFPFMKKDDKGDDFPDQESFMVCYTQDKEKMDDSGEKEILYRVELPNMDELTLVYLENEQGENINQQLCSDENILSYQNVKEIEINYTRPIIILGPLKDQINDDLISDYPEKYECCIPHTTRPKRNNEIDGKDYHFITSRNQMEQDIQNHLFIEAGQYNENLYGTSITAVKNVAEKGKHCILDVSGNAIKRLYAAQLYPIVLFIKLKSAASIAKVYKKISKDEATKAYCCALKIEQEYAAQFTDIIKGDIYEEIYEKIKNSILKHSDNNIWIPTEF